MAKEKIQLVKKEESKWYDLFQFVFAFILGLFGAFLVFNYLPDPGIISITIGFLVGWILAKLIFWLFKKVLLVGIIVIIGTIIFYVVKEWLRNNLPFF
jgi:hypothetical protein